MLATTHDFAHCFNPRRIIAPTLLPTDGTARGCRNSLAAKSRKGRKNGHRAPKDMRKMIDIDKSQIASLPAESNPVWIVLDDSETVANYIDMTEKMRSKNIAWCNKIRRVPP